MFLHKIALFSLSLYPIKIIHALDIRQLKKTYRNGHIALHGIDLTVKEGDFFALLGPNGAGKSTTIGIVTSLVNKTAGQVAVFGYDMDRELSAAKACIGLVPQEFNFSIFESVWQIVLNQAGYYGIPRHIAKARAEKYLSALGLWEKRHQASRNLSGGMKRRLMIARALLHEPKLLILDEPTAGVDIELRRSLWIFLREINQQGITIILTTHYLEEAENLCRSIAIIDRGRIVENTKMSTLLQQLKVETFVLYAQRPLSEFTSIENFNVRFVDERTLEVDVASHQNISEVFQRLSQQGIEIATMRNKANRLEELFLHLTNHGATDD